MIPPHREWGVGTPGRDGARRTAGPAGSEITRVPHGSPGGPAVEPVVLHAVGGTGDRTGRRRGTGALGERPVRVITTLLDEQQYPAVLLGQINHERWAAELVFGEQVRTSENNAIRRRRCGVGSRGA